MAKLILSLDNIVLNEFPLVNERTTIGRRPSSDIQIDNLAVSGEHAVILKSGKDFYIEDQESTNGTEVNAKLIKSHLLQLGDQISFGKHQLKFINDAQLQNQSGSDSVFEKTVLIRPNDYKEMPQTLVHSKLAPISVMADEPAFQSGNESVIFDEKPPAHAILTGKIQVLNGSSIGRELVLNKTLTTLGKIGVQVAVITKRSQGYFLTHVEGEVFPIVNGNSTGAQAFELSNHDVIELAGVKMEFYLAKV